MAGNAKKTVAVARSTSGDGTAVVDAPGAGRYVHIMGGLLMQADPGNDDCTVTIKSGSDTLLVLALSGGVYGSVVPELVCGGNAAVYVSLSTDADVQGALSIAVRSTIQLQD